jgi:hypothetical protein
VTTVQRPEFAAKLAEALKPAKTQKTGGCPHRRARWLTKTRKSTATFRDGGPRPEALRGGRLVKTSAGAQCVRKPGHDGDHRTPDGRAWS